MKLLVEQNRVCYHVADMSLCQVGKSAASPMAAIFIATVDEIEHRRITGIPNFAFHARLPLRFRQT